MHGLIVSNWAGIVNVKLPPIQPFFLARIEDIESDWLLFTGNDWGGERVSIKDILDIWHIRDGMGWFVIFFL